MGLNRASFDSILKTQVKRGGRRLAASFEKERSFNRMTFELIRDMLAVIFPEASSITKNFFIRLTPEALKRAYLTQVSNCHPDTNKQSDKQGLKTRQMHYKRLSTAYRTLLPYIENIHQKSKLSRPRGPGFACAPLKGAKMPRPLRRQGRVIPLGLLELKMPLALFPFFCLLILNVLFYHLWI